MAALSSTERRQHARFPMAMGMQFHHAPTQRDFPARSVDVSRGGMLMDIPANVPVQVGQNIRVNTGGMPHPEFADLGRGTIDGTVVRVDRSRFVSNGHMAIGVRFVRS